MPCGGLGESRCPGTAGERAGLAVSREVAARSEEAERFEFPNDRDIAISPQCRLDPSAEAESGRGRARLLRKASEEDSTRLLEPASPNACLLPGSRPAAPAASGRLQRLVHGTSRNRSVHRTSCNLRIILRFVSYAIRRGSRERKSCRFTHLGILALPERFPVPDNYGVGVVVFHGRY